jgi:hypothetical protein
MRRLNPFRHLTAWIACFAILLAALAPSVTHVLAAAAGGSNAWMEICSTTGTKFISSAVAQKTNPAAPSDQSMQHGHCPFCLAHADMTVLPTTHLFVLPLLAGAEMFPSLFYQSPRPLFMWTAAQSRAPPSIS